MLTKKTILTGATAIVAMLFATASQAAYSYEPVGKPAEVIQSNGSMILARKGADDPKGHVRQGRGKDDAKGHSRKGRGRDDGPNHR